MVVNFIHNTPDYISKLFSSLITLFQSGYTYTDYLLNRFDQMSDSYSLAFAFITLLICMFGLFTGFKYRQYIMKITGFLTGAVIGLLFATVFLNASNGGAMISSFLFGLALAFLTHKKAAIGNFVMCFLLAFILATKYIPLKSGVEFFICLLLGIVIGVYAVKNVTDGIIITTSLFFANFASDAIITLRPWIGGSFLDHPYTKLVALLLLFILGFMIQEATEGKKEKAKKK